MARAQRVQARPQPGISMTLLNGVLMLGVGPGPSGAHPTASTSHFCIFPQRPLSFLQYLFYPSLATPPHPLPPYPQPCYLAFGMLVPPTSNLSCTPCSESSASESLNGQGIPSLSIEVLLTYPLSRESFSGLSVVHLWPLGIPCYCVPG